MRPLLGRIILFVIFFPFITLNISWYSFLTCKVSVERWAVSLMEIPLHVMCCFFLAAFNICSLWSIFVSLINTSLQVPHWIYTVRDSLGFLDIGGYFLPILVNFFTIICSNIFSCVFLLSYFSVNHMIWMLGHLMSQWFLKLSSLFF